MALGDRRPSPDAQVLDALTDAKQLGLTFDEAWPLATAGNVCDSYTSARGNGETAYQQEALDGPPNLRASTGQRRCAGCRFVHDAGHGLARCTLYSRDVFPGVLWPHRTGDRHEWQNALFGDRLDDGDEAGNAAWVAGAAGPGSEPEWRAAYEGEPTRYSTLHEMLRARAAQEQDLAGVYEQALQGGTLAA